MIVGHRARTGGVSFAGAGRWAALLALCLLMVGLLAPVPAQAATPAGDASTPGVWGTHTVTFLALGAPVATVEVADGELVPRQPAPKASDGVFTGWVMSVAGSDVPFDFDTTVVTDDLTVEARFTDTHVVQFLAPEGLQPPIRVLSTNEVADGAPVGDIAPDVTDVPSGVVFTGSWYVQGDASREPYDFGVPLTRDLVLIPVVAEGFAVSFVTDGTAIDPIFVLEPATEFTQGDLDAVPAPTRKGYVFDGWYADEGRTQPAVLPLTSSTTLYADWDGTQVEYHTSYWLERPGVLPDEYPSPVWTDEGSPLPAWGPGDGALSPAQLRDRSNFDFLRDVPATAMAGTTVSGPTDKNLIPASVKTVVRAQLDPAVVQPDPMAFADIGLSEADVVRGDGSTVVNVYLTRSLWRVDYRLRAPGLAGEASRCAANAPYEVSMTVDDKLYYESSQPDRGDGHRIGTFSARAKIGLDLSVVGAGPLPLSQTDDTHLINSRNADTHVENCVMRGWGPQQVTSTTFQAVFTGSYADAGGVNLAAGTTSMSSKWVTLNSQHLTQRLIYGEAEDQAQAAPDQVLGADGPNDPLRVSTLYNNDKKTVRAAIPAGKQVFEQLSSFRYWAALGDRQVAAVVDGFTSYVGYGTGAATQGNYFQLDQDTNHLYQLANSGNTNDDYRYQFYSRNAYDLVFVTGGGTAIPTAAGVRYGSSLAPLEPSDPMRDDDIFQGWFTDSSYSEPFSFEDTTMPASNLVLYAKWLVDPHTVEFYAQASATDPIANLTQTVEDQAQATEPSSLPPRPDGSTFLGWYQRTKEGYFVEYDFDAPVGSDLRLYARWKQPPGSPFTLTYDGDQNTGGSIPTDPWSYNAGTGAIVADGSGLVRGDEVFIGWRPSSPPKTKPVVTPRSGPIDGLYQAGRVLGVGGENVTLVAVYANPSPRYTVTFRENAGAGAEVLWTGVPGASITYPGADDLSFTGPAGSSGFLGWSTDPSATKPDSAYDRLVVSQIKGDLVLYAVWKTTGPNPSPTPTPDNPGGGGSLARTGVGLGVLVLALLALGLGTALVVRARRERH